MPSKLLQKVSLETNLLYDLKRNILYGSYQGYMFVVKEITQSKRLSVIMGAKHRTESDDANTQYFLTELKDTTAQIVQTGYTPSSITVIMKLSSFKKNFATLMNIIGGLCHFAISNQMITCCQNCGQEYGISVLSLDGTPSILCDTCYTDVAAHVETTRTSMRARKGNYFAGVVGALLGSLIGVVLWVIVYRLGYIAAIVGLVFSVCTIKGFVKFGGKLNIMGLITPLVICTGMLYIAHSIAVALDIYTYYRAEGFTDITFFDAYRALPEFLAYSADLRRMFIRDLVVGFLFMGVASISPIIQLYRSSNGIMELEVLGKLNYQPLYEQSYSTQPKVESSVSSSVDSNDPSIV